MKYKKGLVFICLIICLFGIAGACASEANEVVAVSDDAGMDNAVSGMESSDETIAVNDVEQMVETGDGAAAVSNNGKIESEDDSKSAWSVKEDDSDLKDDVDWDWIVDDTGQYGDYEEEFDYNAISKYDFEVYDTAIYESARKGNINGPAIEIHCDFEGGTFYAYINNVLKSQKANMGVTTFTLKELGIVKSGFYKYAVKYKSPTGKMLTVCADQDVIIVKENIKLTLKTVKVKKSAKKLILQATLKKDKNPLKNKKITFRFNGKKYITKTNKNGVAKVTIKKSALKNLKAGKKVTYSAAYGRIIKEVKVTVKK